jgi:glycosyltransferase involved in cell wall biosynthesis
MDVAIVTPRYPPTVSGGVEISVQLLAHQVKKNDCVNYINVFCFDGKGREIVNGVSVTRLGNYHQVIKELLNLIGVVKLQNYLQDYDIVHSYNMNLHPAVGYLSYRHDYSSVATLNTYTYLPESVVNADRGLIKRAYKSVTQETTGRLLRSMMEGIDLFFPLSLSTKSEHVRFGFEKNKMEVVPNMIDPNFVPSNFEFNRDDSGKYNLLYIGRLREVKGVEYLIRSLTHLPSEIVLKIVGDGRRREHLHKISNNIGVDERVNFVGKVPHSKMPDIYKQADLFVHPGIWPEPFGRTILEAMQVGLPVVATNIGGPAEIIPKEEYLCEPGNVIDLANTINYARIQNYQFDYKEYISQKYSPDKIVEQVVDKYRKIK